MKKGSSTKPEPPSEHGKFPARLHVLLAREAKIGLVIRRGPSKSVCTVLWDRERNRFQPGQWMRGRIYERRSDLSPDGRHFIYFAMNGRWKSETRGSWTAISRVPHLKAISLFAKGDCWNGGGLFLSNREFWLNGGCGHTQLRDTKAVSQSTNYNPPGYYGGECLTVYYNRLQRDGWTLCGEELEDETLFEKTLPESWLLRKLAFAEMGAPPGRGCYWDAHELRHQSSNTTLAFPEWEWADFVDERLVWASEGRLYTANLGKGELRNEKLVYDFNDMEFQAIAAPY